MTQNMASKGSIDDPIEVESSNSDPIDDGNFSDFVKNAFNAIKKGIKASNSLPSSENFNYYTCFPTFNKIRSKHSKVINNLMQDVIKKTEIAGNIKQRDLEEKFDLIVEANDVLLDRLEARTDQECGLNKGSNIELVVSQTQVERVNGSWNKTNPQSRSNQQAVRLLAAKNIQRPQLTFKDKIDNSLKPWRPTLKDKPNSLRPLLLHIEDLEDDEYHPYDYELQCFEVPEIQLKKEKIIKYKSVEETPIIMVEKFHELKSMLEDLLNQKEIAIDLEHHSYRSFQGITCLMQISTRDKDYVIDTLSLRSQLNILNEVFTKSTILKVFHGADSDVQWLQRDFSLYIVNMFDTHQAAKQLNFPYLSLAYLMKTYCNVDPNKHFQLADWRIRPLPEELVKYAREDTHYLLHIKDILKNLLIEADNGKSNVLKVVYNNSTEICKKVYQKPLWTDQSYMNVYRKSQKMFNSRQLYALRELYKWRDQTAREEDDSTNYVLPNHMMLNIAETLPREMQGVLACCNPIPPLVRQNLLKIHKLILKAREQPLTKSIFETEMKQRMTQRSQVSVSESWILMPHDMSGRMEATRNLVCLLDKPDNNKEMPEPISHKLKYITIFDQLSDDESAESSSSPKRKTAFISPFKRYKLVIPMVVEQEKKEREAKEKQEEERIKELRKDKKETTESIERVHQHFMNVSGNKRKSCDYQDDTEVEVIAEGQETSASINRVHEHFMKVAHASKKRSFENSDDLDIKEVSKNHFRPSFSKRKFNAQSLNECKGKKRKRHLSREMLR